MTSLPAADCSRSLLLQSETRGRRWFDGVSVVQPVPMSMMTVGVVDLVMLFTLLCSMLTNRTSALLSSCYL